MEIKEFAKMPYSQKLEILKIRKKELKEAIKEELKRRIEERKKKEREEERKKTPFERTFEKAYITRQYLSYLKTGKPPTEIPPQIKELGPRAEKSYIKAVTQVSLGIKTEKEAQEELQKVMEEEFKKLPEKKREEYGFKYTEWEKIPFEERKYYPGAQIHYGTIPYEERKKIVVSELKKIYKKFGLETKDIEKKITKEQVHEMWQALTLPEQEFKEKRFAKMHLLDRIGQTFADVFTRSFAFPVIIGQQIAGLAGVKKPKWMPDFSKPLVSPVPGAFTGALEEGIAYVTDTESKAFEYMQKYPVETVFATLGEMAGFWLGGKAITGALKGVSKGISHTLKFTIRGIPKIYYRISKLRPYRIYRIKPGKETVPFLKKVSRRPIPKDIQAWARGEKVFIKEYGVKAVKVFKPKFKDLPGVETYAKKIIYRRFGKLKLVPKEMPIEKPGKYLEISFKKIYEAPGIGRKVITAHMRKFLPGGFLKRMQKRYVTLTKTKKFEPPYSGGLPAKPEVLLKFKPSKIFEDISKWVLGKGVPSIYVRGSLKYTPFVIMGTMMGLQTAIKQMQRQTQIKKLGLKPISIPKIEGIKIQRWEQEWGQKWKQEWKQRQIQKSALDQLLISITIPKPTKTTIKQPKITTQLKTPKLKLFPFLIYSEEKIRKRLKILSEDWGKFYYYREFKVPQLEKVVKRIERMI